MVVIPLLDDGRVLLERQFRYPIGRVMTEFPAGKLDPGEDPLACGKRELLEETGYTAAHGPTPARCTWRSPIPPRSSTSSSRAACAPGRGSWTRTSSWT